MLTKRLLLLLIPLALLAAACGGDDDDDTASAGGASSDVAGEVIVSGSSTVAPISGLVAELFQEENGDVSVTVDGPGTGDGFQLFCQDDIDIADASRPIKEEEAAACEENGVTYVELKIAFDGLTVMTNPANDAVACLTFADLYAIAGPESQGIDRWSDAAELAAELGSTTELPDLDLSITAPGEESGTYDSFVELAWKSIGEDRAASGAITEDEIATSRPDYQASADDNVIIQGIAGADGAFGWVGFAFAEEAGDQVKEIEIDGGDGCVAPSADTIADGTYPLSRELFIYVNAARATDSAAVAAYVDYFLHDGIAAVEETGYVPLPDEQLAETRSAWEGR